MDKLLPLDLPAGVYANGTEYEAKGRWMVADLIRWYNGHMRPIGGWQRFTKDALPEPARSAFSWRRNDGTPFAAFGTAAHLLWTDGALVTDITPYISAPTIGTPTTATTGGTIPAGTHYVVVTAYNSNGETLASTEKSIATTGSTSEITVPWTPVTDASGYWVYVGSTPGGENQAFQVVGQSSSSKVLTTLTGTAQTPPTTSTAVDLTIGHIDAGGGDGYGAQDYSDETYGTPRTGAGVYDATTWDLDNFGQVLMAMSSADGRLMQWDASSEPAEASFVVASGSTPVPTGNAAMFVTDERMVVLLGSGGDPREIQWSNQGDYTMWDATENTTAGDLQLKSNGRALAGCKAVGTNLIWTDADIHTLTYVGYPYIYGSQRIGNNCGIISKHAFAAMTNMAVWMGNLGFFMYNGIVQPLPCEVQKAVFDNLNRDQASKIVCGVNSQYDEIWWFFPSLNSTENDSYCYWNYKENHWSVSFGSMARTAWVDREVWPFPIACGADYNMYEQEVTWLAAGLSRNGLVQAISGPLDVGNGDNIINGNQILTDTNDGSGAVSLSIRTKYAPNGAETTWGPYAMRSDGYTDCRFNGRQMKLAISQTSDGLWQFGNIRIAATQGGQR